MLACPEYQYARAGKSRKDALFSARPRFSLIRRYLFLENMNEQSTVTADLQVLLATVMSVDVVDDLNLEDMSHGE